MSPKVRRWLLWAAYPAFYLVCLLVFAKLTFPYGRLKSALLGRFHAEQPVSGGMRLEIDDLSSYWLTGIEAEGIRLIQSSPPAPGAPPVVKALEQVTAIEALHVSPSLLSLLIGKTAVSFGGDALGGSLDGEYEFGETRELRLELDELSLGEVPMIGALVGLPLDGKLSGSVELSLPEGKLSAADGTVEIHVSEVRVGDGKAKIRDAIALPAVNAGELAFKAESTGGRVTVQELSVKGPDLELVAEGKAVFRDPLGRTTLSVDARFRFSDSYKSKDDITRSLFGAPDSSVPGLLDLDPKMKSAKEPDGFYGWRISGVLSNPTFAPVPGAAAGGSARKR